MQIEPSFELATKQTFYFLTANCAFLKQPTCSIHLGWNCKFCSIFYGFLQTSLYWCLCNYEIDKILKDLRTNHTLGTVFYFALELAQVEDLQYVKSMQDAVLSNYSLTPVRHEWSSCRFKTILKSPFIIHIQTWNLAVRNEFCDCCSLGKMMEGLKFRTPLHNFPVGYFASVEDSTGTFVSSIRTEENDEPLFTVSIRAPTGHVQVIPNQQMVDCLHVWKSHRSSPVFTSKAQN